MALKRTAIDIAFSNLVRERANYTCERCGTYYPEGRRQGLHCSHFYSRRHKSTRWFGLNAFAHCYACHQYLGGNPAIFTAWVRNLIGDGAMQILEERHNQVFKTTKGWEKEGAAYFRNEKKIIEEKRIKGETGYIEFLEFY